MLSRMSPMFLSLLLVLLSWIITFPVSPTVGSLAKPGCSDTCGNIRIPYPFGIGPGCSLNESYTIICTSSKPYLSNLNLEVLNVSLRRQTVTVSTTVTPFCSSGNQASAISSWRSNSSDLGGAPFFYSKIYNYLVIFGCGNAVLINQNDKILSGCTSTCEFNSPAQAIDTSSCYGVNCCETTIPFYLSKYHLNFTASRFSLGGTGNCSSVFLADQNWSPEKFLESTQSVPVVLAWTLGRNDVQAIYPCAYGTDYLELESGGYLANFMCSTCEFGRTGPQEINPYLQDQCRTRFIVDPGRRNLKAALIGVFAGVGVLIFIAISFTSYKLVKRRRDKMIKEKFFKRNGGLLLQQQLSADDRVINKTRIFTAKDLDKATDHFNENRVLGRGGQGTVYKGMLADGNLAAIKKSKKVDESQLGEFINEVVILSQVNHRNVVKLLGCCLETEVPILVYELIPNGTLFRLIHNENDDEFPFTWSLRLRMAAEVAGALAYLHSATSVPIYHRDIKSSNILLDEKYVAKVSDFGTSRSVSIDKTHFTTMVKGTFGYLDPAYFQSSQFTEKSDVYSFGVVLVELLTRKKPVSSELEEDSHLSLATRFLITMDENRLNSILDPELQDQRTEEEVVAVAKLAQRCLNLNGKKRPTMKEVATELDSIKMSANQSTNQANYESQGFKKEGSKSVAFSDNYPSWTSTGTNCITLSSAA
ncbi:wall-associated receptor kinase-like 1 [Coffea arabica]|uniref:Wall-associated receptor kinase-like 1 n=1 Tax=Coffea arabica TaxID=13443 RepID=A0A6P6UBQ6_COFAR|nr:wall-associated receptor kinase-like 1 [Coffea arabica]